MNGKIFLIAGLGLVVLIVIFLTAGKGITGGAIQGEVEEDIGPWLKANCDCVAKEKKECRWEGFVYDEERDFCRSKGNPLTGEGAATTRPVLACSQYVCENESYVWNNTEEKWKSEK